MKTVIIQNYSIVTHPSYSENPYLAPEAKPSCVKGNAYGYEQFEDGKLIYSAPIVKVVDEETYETTDGIIVKLGKKSEEYQLFMNGYNAQ